MSGPGYSAAQMGRNVNQSGICNAPERKIDGTVEAVVLAVYYPDEETRLEQTCITADVRTLGRQTRILSKVPVFQPIAGLFDEDTYVPRGTSQAIDGSTLQTEAGTHAPTPAEIQDGDRVLVGFLDSTNAKPFIWPVQVPHPAKRTSLSAAGGRRRRIRHNGTLLEIDNVGSLLLDARGAAQDTLGERGTEVSSSGTGGVVEAVTKDAAGAESRVKLDASGGVVLEDGAQSSIRLTKTPPRVEAESKGTMALQSAGAMTVGCPTLAVTATASAEIAAPLVTLGVAAAAMPLVKHTIMAPLWTALQGVTQVQTLIYNPPPPAIPPPVVSVADYLLLLQTINALAAGFAASTTVNTKGS